jgi:hypothetical protein
LGQSRLDLETAGFYEGTVMRVPIGGGVPTALARQQNLAGPFATFGNFVYWAVNGSLASNGSSGPSLLRLSTDAYQEGVCR